MPAKDLGTKFTCYKCSTRFYDLKKPDPICPKCGADQRESPALKPTPRRSREKEVVVPVEREAEAPEEAEEEEAADEEDEDAVEDEPADDF
jgi:uncharacterized protein (TIGR02300 family)